LGAADHRVQMSSLRSRRRVVETVLAPHNHVGVRRRARTRPASGMRRYCVSIVSRAARHGGREHLRLAGRPIGVLGEHQLRSRFGTRVCRTWLARLHALPALAHSLIQIRW